jgi:hypothetical protein
LFDEFVIKFTHTLQMDWLLPGVPATNKPVEVATMTVVQFQDGKMASEGIYFDQASACQLRKCVRQIQRAVMNGRPFSVIWPHEREEK